MAELNFTKLADAPVLESVPDGAKVYAEVEGKVYRVAGDNLGGGVKTAVFKIVQEDPGELMSLREKAVATASAGDNARDASYFYTTCENMTYEEAKALLLAGKPLAATVCRILKQDGVVTATGYFNIDAIFTEDTSNEKLPIWMVTSFNDEIYWYPDGTITDDPGYGQIET